MGHLADGTKLSQKIRTCDFCFREVSKEIGIGSFFGVLNNDRRAAQPACRYDTVRRIDFPAGVVIKDQAFALVLLVAQPMFLTNSVIERHDRGGPFLDATAVMVGFPTILLVLR